MRFPLEVFEAVRGAFPVGKPVWARLSATDWVPGGWDIDSTLVPPQYWRSQPREFKGLYMGASFGAR